MSNELIPVELPAILKTMTDMPKKVPVGTKLSVKPVNEFKTAVGLPQVIKFLDTCFIPKKIHWIKKGSKEENNAKHMGLVECNGGLCCGLSKEQPRLYYFGAAVEYSVESIDPKTRQPKYDMLNLTFKYTKILESVYDQK